MYASKPIQSLNKAQFGQGMVLQMFFRIFKIITKLQLLRQENPLRECWDLILKGMTCIRNFEKTGTGISS